MVELQPKLAHAKQLFKDWRSNRDSRQSPIPKQLIKAAARAANESGFAMTMRELNVSGLVIGEGKRLLKSEKPSKHKTSVKNNHRIEVTKVIPVSTPNTTLSPIVEIELSKGAKVRFFGNVTEIDAALRVALGTINEGQSLC